MSVIIRAHFDGINIIPDEPVDLPVNEPLEFELKAKAGRSTEQEAAWERLKSKRLTGLSISDEALRRENMYEPPRGL